jgi:hypothetical protein
MEIMVNLVLPGRPAPVSLSFLRPFTLLFAPVALFLCLSAPPATAALEIPVGVSYLANSDRASLQDVLDNPNIDGLSIRASWNAVETSDGVYDWSFIDSEVAKAAASGKWVFLRIMTQQAKPQWVTDAIIAAGGKFFRWEAEGTTNSCPVFWDPTYVAKKKEMIAALGARYGHNPTIKIVGVSFANATSEDWNVPHLPENVAQWLALGWNTDVMLDTWKQFVDTAMTGFPNAFVSLAINGNGHTSGLNLDPDADYLARNAILYAELNYPGRLIVQKNGFSTTTTPAPGGEGNFELLYDAYPSGGAQMLFWCFNEPTYRMNGGVPGDPANILRNTTNICLGYRVRFMEIYQLDCVNLPGEIAYAHNALHNVPNPTPTPSPTPPAPPTGLRVVD